MIQNLKKITGCCAKGFKIRSEYGFIFESVSKNSVSRAAWLKNIRRDSVKAGRLYVKNFESDHWEICGVKLKKDTVPSFDTNHSETATQKIGQKSSRKL